MVIELSAVEELSLALVIEANEIGRHAAGEDIVDGVDEISAGAEVFVQIDAGLGGNLCRRLIGTGKVGSKLIKFSEEDSGIGLSETIDALFDVADHKEIAGICLVFPVSNRRGMASGDRLQEGFLDGRDVLVFINEDEAVSVAELEGEIGGLVILLKQLKRQVFEVGEVEDILSSFGVVISLEEVLLQIQEQIDRGG